MSGGNRKIALAGLLLILVFDAWWRGHTFGPTVLDRLGVAPWPVVRGETEPLDCDEAIYAYIGKRLVAGDVMYRDLTENKPPLGYALYALAVAVGGANELTIRLLPVPLALGTIALVWWIALRMGGTGAGLLAGFLYAILSTDPYLYGNGMQLEQPINLLASAALAVIVGLIDRRPAEPPESSRRRLLAAGLAGALVAGSTAIRQVAILPGLLYVAFLLTEPGRSWRGRLQDLAAFGAGFLLVGSLVIGVLAGQGALREAYDDIVRYGGALATDVAGDPHAPSVAVRWLTGNADPRGELPPPFGRTTYLVWWGTGSWPLWLAGLPALGWLLLGPGGRDRRLLALWVIAAWVQLALPRQYWAHYYLLPTPGLAVAVGLLASDAARAAARGRGAGRGLGMLVLLAVSLAIGATTWFQIRDYLLVPADELTVRYKGGGQWRVLRELGRELRRRSRRLEAPTLYVWGIQSPLYIYGQLDGVTRQVFADNLIRDYADRDHPVIRPRIEQTVRDLRARPPTMIFAGYPPFAGLRALLREQYVPVALDLGARTIPILPSGLGLWIRRDQLDAFEAAGRGQSGRGRPASRAS